MTPEKGATLKWGRGGGGDKGCTEGVYRQKSLHLDVTSGKRDCTRIGHETIRLHWNGSLQRGEEAEKHVVLGQGTGNEGWTLSFFLDVSLPISRCGLRAQFVGWEPASDCRVLYVISKGTPHKKFASYLFLSNQITLLNEVGWEIA